MNKDSQYNLNNILNKIKDFKGNFKIDSRDISSGDIFIALKGSKDHGENYIEDALNNKARFVISENILPKYEEKTIKVDDCLETLTLIGKYKRSIYKGKVIGITGSVGKTSTKEQIKFFLNFVYKTYSSIKSYNNNLGVSLSLANLDLNSSIAVLEIGTSNFGEIAELTKLVKPHIAIITNIGPVHLKNFNNIRNVVKEKSDIFNYKYNPDLQSIIIPYYLKEENYISQKVNENKNCKILSFGNDKKADIFINDLKRINDEKFLTEVKIFNKKFKYEISAKGEHQVINSLITLLIFHILDIKIENFKKNATSLPELSGRGKIHCLLLNKKNIILIDESYNASPLSMKETIKYFNNYSKNSNYKKYLILGDMLELGDKEIFFHSEIKKYLNYNSFYQVLTLGSLISNLHKSCYDKNNIFHFEDEYDLYQHLIKSIDNNDIVLAKCSNATLVNKFIKKIIKMNSINKKNIC